MGEKLNRFVCRILPQFIPCVLLSKISVFSLVLCAALGEFNIPTAHGEDKIFQHLCETATADQLKQVIEHNSYNDREYDFALFHALKNPNVGVIRVLLNQGAKLESRWKGMTPLHSAARYLGHKTWEGKRPLPHLPLSSFTDMLDAGADINVSSAWGTPLHFALVKGDTDGDTDVEFVKFLLSKGANVNAQTENFGETPLIRAVATRESLELIDILINAGADIEAVSTITGYDSNSTVLMWAAFYDRSDIAKLLIERGVKMDARNSEGKTAYDIAVENRNGKVADTLFFKNNIIAHRLAYVLYVIFGIWLFGLFLLYLYKYCILRLMIDKKLFISCMLVIISFLLTEFLLNTYISSKIPLLKKITLLLICDCLLVSQSRRISYGGKGSLFFFVTAGIFNLVWIVDPWLYFLPNIRMGFYLIFWLESLRRVWIDTKGSI
jgi:ankyrin repeat protein